MSYNVLSSYADDFINDDEILETLDYAEKHRSDRPLLLNILEKARKCRGVTHREAAVLLECDQPDLNEEILSLAKEIKLKFYGNRIVLFAPLYLSNYCVNCCTYCPYHGANRHISRKKLTQD